MSPIVDAMRARRSVRKFKPEAPARDLVERLIEAAVTAPSASNKQPWRFFVISNRAKIDAMAAAVRERVAGIAAHIEPVAESAFRAYGDYFTRFENAPLVIVALYRALTVLSNLVDARLGDGDRARIAVMERDSGLIGTALALENLLLAAPELGLGASAMTGPLVAVDRIKEIAGVPESWEVAALVAVGFPAEAPHATDRKPVEKVIRWIE